MITDRRKWKERTLKKREVGRRALSNKGESSADNGVQCGRPGSATLCVASSVERQRCGKQRGRTKANRLSNSTRNFEFVCSRGLFSFRSTGPLCLNWNAFQPQFDSIGSEGDCLFSVVSTRRHYCCRTVGKTGILGHSCLSHQCLCSWNLCNP